MNKLVKKPLISWKLLTTLVSSTHYSAWHWYSFGLLWFTKILGHLCACGLSLRLWNYGNIPEAKRPLAQPGNPSLRTQARLTNPYGSLGLGEKRCLLFPPEDMPSTLRVPQFKIQRMAGQARAGKLRNSCSFLCFQGGKYSKHSGQMRLLILKSLHLNLLEFPPYVGLKSFGHSPFMFALIYSSPA